MDVDLDADRDMLHDPEGGGSSLESPPEREVSHQGDRPRVADRPPGHLPGGESDGVSARPVGTVPVLAPPVPNPAFDLPSTTRHVPLAAKAPSPGMAGGIPAVGVRVQVLPPSSVAKTANRPSTGSPNARPWSASQKAIASRKPEASG